MTRLVRTHVALLCVAASLLFVGGAAAQQRVPGTSAFVASPFALGMGGAGTAYPTARTALFYNPAHLTQLNVTRAPVTMLGFGASISSNLSDQLDFYNNRIQPALDQGIENLSDDEEQALYDDIFRMGSTPTTISGDVLLPSFVQNKGSFGYGGGVFVHGETVYRVEDAGAGVPGVDFTALVDFMAVAAGSADLSTLGLKGLSTGLTTKYSQRYLSLKDKPIDAFEEDESVYVLGASAVSLDLGVLYKTGFNKVPGNLYLGAVWSDLTLKNFDYAFAAYYVKNEEVQRDDVIASEAELAQDRYQLGSSFRAGASYVLPVLAGPLKETAFAIDYVRYPQAFADQPMLGNLSLGLQTTLGKVLSLRTGINQGYSTLGAGLQLPFAQIDYVYYGSEQGRLPGQAPSWHHRVQLTLGSF